MGNNERDNYYIIVHSNIDICQFLTDNYFDYLNNPDKHQKLDALFLEINLLICEMLEDDDIEGLIKHPSYGDIKLNLNVFAVNFINESYVYELIKGEVTSKMIIAEKMVFVEYL